MCREFKHEGKIRLPLFRNCSPQLDSEICRSTKMFGLLSVKVSGKSKLQNVEVNPDTATF